MSGLTPLQESILILLGIKNQIEVALKSIRSKERVQDEGLKFTVCNHIQILVCSFLEEWRRLERLGVKSEIQKTLKIASPAIDRIKQWRGLDKVRSQLLAHPQRDSDGNFVPPWRTFASYSAPTTYAETILLGNCVIKATSVVLKRHAKEYRLAFAMVQSRAEDIADKGIKTVGDVKTELERIDSQIAERFHLIT
jgi:hypothetical protein